MPSQLAGMGAAGGVGTSVDWDTKGIAAAHRCLHGEVSLVFDTGDANNHRAAIFEDRIDDSYDSGNDVTFEIVWKIESTAADPSSEVVEWKVAIRRLQAGTTDVSATTGFAASVDITDSPTSTDWMHLRVTATLTNAQLDSIAAGDLFQCLIHRDGDDVTDTIAADDDPHLVSWAIYQ